VRRPQRSQTLERLKFNLLKMQLPILLVPAPFHHLGPSRGTQTVLEHPTTEQNVTLHSKQTSRNQEGSLKIKEWSKSTK
jgi:hypothetical protein